MLSLVVRILSLVGRQACNTLWETLICDLWCSVTAAAACFFLAVYICGLSVQDKLEALVKASQAFQEQPAEMEALWDSCSCPLYSLEDKQKQLGLGDKVGSWII